MRGTPPCGACEMAARQTSAPLEFTSRRQECDTDMICSAGREMRDYETLIEALDGTGNRCHIAGTLVQRPSSTYGTTPEESARMRAEAPRTVEEHRRMDRFIGQVSEVIREAAEDSR